MAERFALSAQASGFISFRYPIEDASTYGPTVHALSIPEGMICIGGNGRGYVLESREAGSTLGVYIFTPILTEGEYIMYASDPVDGAGNGTGIADIDHMEFDTYINGGTHPNPTKYFHGDTNTRRAFSYFRVEMVAGVATIKESSIVTFTSFNFYEQYDKLKKIGFYQSKSEVDFTFRGNYWDEDVHFTDASSSWASIPVKSWDLVYKKVEYDSWATGTYNLNDMITENGYDWLCTQSGTTTGSEPNWASVTDLGDTINDPTASDVIWTKYRKSAGIYDQAIANDTTKEVIIGIAELDRDSITNDNFVITSGIVDTGTTVLPDDQFPVGTYLYLTNKEAHITTQRDDYLGAGNIVRDFDDWEENHVYEVGDKIRPITSKTTTPWTHSIYIYECITAGTSDIEGSKPTFPTTINGTVAESGAGTLVWNCESLYDAQKLQNDRKVRIGVSLGHGVILLQPGSAGTSIEDHNSSATAHDDIQTAMEKAGIYVVNEAQGKGVLEVQFQGQHFDEQATFSSGSTYDIVYKTNTNHQYGPALAGGAGNIDNPIGIRLSSSKVACGTGFVDYDTTAAGPSGLLTSGAKLYLSSASAGTLTTVRTDITPFVGYCIQGNTDLTQAAGEARGCILLLLSTTNEDVTSSMLIDEVADISGGGGASVYDLVYKTTTTAHEYGPAQAGEAGNIDNAVGLALSTTSVVLGSGLVQYDTSAAGPSGELTNGAKLYLSSASAGKLTMIKTDITPFVGHCIVGASTIASGGLIFLNLSTTDEDVASSMLLDEQATLAAPAVTGNILYKTTTDHEYGQAIGGGSGNIDNAVGIALSTTTVALGTGLVQYDCSAATGPSGLITSGDKLYLSSATAGLITTTKGLNTPYLGYCVKGSVNIAGGGLIYLMIASNDEDLTGAGSVNEGDFFVNDDVFAGIQSIIYEDKVVSHNGTTMEVAHVAHPLIADDYIYLTSVTNTGANLTRDIYKVKATTADTFTLKTVADLDIADTLSADSFVSWVGPQASGVTPADDSLIDGTGFFIPGATMHSMTYDDTLDGWIFTNNLIISSTGVLVIPKGTTGEAPTAADYSGGLRWNTTTLTMDTSNGSVWEAQATEGFATAIAIALG